MTKKIITIFKSIVNLFLILPDTEFAKYCIEAHKLVEREPEILERIQKDLELDAKKKKKIRLLNKQWEANQTSTLPGMEKFLLNDLDENQLELGIGRPRMSPYVVYMFMMGRGYYGGIKSNYGAVLTGESKTLHIFLENQNLRMPSANSVYDNINAVSNETREFIFDAQIRMIMNEDFDNFKELTIDSTAVEGNVCWPKDSNIISGLIERIFKRGNNLDKFDINNIEKGCFPHLIKKIKKLSKKINMESGKKDSEKKRRKYYRTLIKLAKEAIILFLEEFKKIEEKAKEISLKPDKHIKLCRLVEMIQEDINNVEKVIGYTSRRIFDGEKISSKEKIMSISDKDAAFIQKGGREAVVGYKPQLGKSREGFISSLIVPEGNAADSNQFKIVVNDSIDKTGIIPEIISTDDGYANKTTREELLELGVKIVSISGSKGKKLTEEEWESEEYIKTRNDRSAVESLMFTIKYKFDFGYVVRRGIENVRAELLEKVLAYNFCKIINLRERERLKLAS